MPCLRIMTNVTRNEIPADFINKIIPVLAKVLRKDEKRFTVVISGDCQVSMAGDASRPSAVATLESVGHVGPEDNQLTAREVSQFVEKELGVQPDRFFLSFYDVRAANISKGGTTLEGKL